MMNSLHELFEYYNITDEYLEDDLLYEMADRCRNIFFLGNMTPPLDVRDLVHILKYYAQYESAPSFYTFDDIDKNKLDVAKIAQTIWDEDMGPRKKAEYIDTLWENADDNLLKLFFGRKLYLWKQIDIELAKISTPDIYDEPNIKYGQRNIEELSLYEIGQIDPEYEKKLRDDAFTKSVDKDGKYILHYQTSSEGDSFGHLQLGGVALVLANTVSAKLKLPVRAIELNLPQRCAAHLASLTDVKESTKCGEFGVKSVLKNKSGYMVSMERVTNYKIKYVLKPLDKIATMVKSFPLEWIINGNQISNEYVEYVLPLIQGESYPKFVNGLPVFAKISK
jgi:hypothetical protein